MVKIKVSVIMPTKDGSEFLPRTIDSLLKQSIECKIFIIDDHSKDRTKLLLDGYTRITKRIKHMWYPYDEPRDYHQIGRKLNMLLPMVDAADFYMISGDDTFFPSNYVEDVIEQMLLNDTHIASGYSRKYSDRDAPDGSGRIFSNEVWHKVTPFYDSIGWESGLMYKAQSLGYKLGKYPIKKEHLRPYSEGSIRTFGHGSYTLGNPLWWTMLRVFRDIVSKNKKPRNAMQILFGHVEFMIKRKPKVSIADWNRKQKNKRIWKELKVTFIKLPFIYPIAKWISNRKSG